MSPSKNYDFLSTYDVDRAVMSWAGVYYGANDTKSYLIRRTFLFSLQIFFVISMTMFITENLKDTTKMSETLFICLTMVTSISKTINFIVNFDEIILLEEYLKNDILYDAANGYIIKEDIKRTQKLVKLYRIMATQAIVTHFALPFFASNNGYRLPISSNYPWNTDVLLNYLLTCLLQIATVLISASVNVTIDTLFANFCTIAYAEFRVLKNNLENLDYSLGDSQIRFKLQENICLYSEIIRICEAIENLFSYGVLVQFIISIIVICFTGFHLTSTTENAKRDAFEQFSYLYACLCYLGCLLIQVSIYCIYGHDVNIESANINQAIYLSNWYIPNNTQRHDLLILRERVKRAIILTAGKMFPLTVETLIKIFRSSYSFFAFLQQKS